MTIFVAVFFVVVSGVVFGMLWASCKAMDEVEGFDDLEGEGRG